MADIERWYADENREKTKQEMFRDLVVSDKGTEPWAAEATLNYYYDQVYMTNTSGGFSSEAYHVEEDLTLYDPIVDRMTTYKTCGLGDYFSSIEEWINLPPYLSRIISEKGAKIREERSSEEKKVKDELDQLQKKFN